MARLTIEGRLYLHLLVFDLLFAVFVILKRFDLASPSNSPVLTTDQTNALIILLAAGALLLFWTMVRTRAYRVKTARGMSTVAAVLAFMGLVGYAIVLFLDVAQGADNISVGATGQMLIMTASMFSTVAGAIFVELNFPDKVDDMLFKSALREEFRSFMKQARDEAAAARQAAAMEEAVEVEPIEEGEVKTGENVVSCAKCSQALRIPPDSRRPLGIKCPSCGEIQTVG